MNCDCLNNVDIDRLKTALESESVVLPSGLTRDEARLFIINSVKSTSTVSDSNHMEKE